MNVLGSNIFLLVRGNYTYGNGIFEDSRLFKSTDNGNTWDSGVVILNTNTSPGHWERPYCTSIYDPNKLRYIISRLDDSSVLYTHAFYVESTDGITFSNISGSFSKNVVTSGAITQTELVQNYLLHSDPTYDVEVKACLKTSSGMVVAALNDSITGYIVAWSNGGVWNKKKLPIPNYLPTGQTGTHRVDFFHLYSYSDSHFILWRIEKRAGFDVVVQYETFDLFTTVDAGTIVSANNLKHELLHGTYNVNDASKIVITCNQVGAEYNKIFIYEYTPQP